MAVLSGSLVVSERTAAHAEPTADADPAAAEEVEASSETPPLPSEAPPEPPPTPPEPPPEPPEPPARLSIGPNLPEITGPWRPPPFVEGEKDWLQLTSGEWLHGEIERIHDETVYFDSIELDDLEVDWEDIASLRSPRRNTYRFARDEIVTGTAGMNDGVIRIDTGEEIVEFKKDDLFGAIEGDMREINYWSLEVGVSMSLRAGNSSQTDADLSLEVKRETPLTEFNVSYQSAYGVVESDEVTNNQRVTGLFAYYLSRRVFVNIPTVELFRDRLQNIDLRSTAGVGIGYDVFDAKRVAWDLVLGGGYEGTTYDSVQPGEARREEDASVTFSTTLELDPTGDIEWDTSYRLALVVTDLGKTNHHIKSVFSIDLFGPLDLDITANFDRIEQPRPDDDGDRPERNDLRLTVGLSLEL